MVEASSKLRGYSLISYRRSAVLQVLQSNAGWKEWAQFLIYNATTKTRSIVVCRGKLRMSSFPPFYILILEHLTSPFESGPAKSGQFLLEQVRSVRAAWRDRVGRSGPLAVEFCG